LLAFAVGVLPEIDNTKLTIVPLAANVFKVESNAK
jgi:hypothetical protein